MALIFPYLVAPYCAAAAILFRAASARNLEAAKIDGASEWRIFYQIVIPLSTPALATIGLFTRWPTGTITGCRCCSSHRSQYIPLQYLLYNMLNNVEVLTRTPEAMAPAFRDPAAGRVAAHGDGGGRRRPAVIFSLVLGRYFVRGITLGALNK
jgi:putative aldouronate transport system permease protein